MKPIGATPANTIKITNYEIVDKTSCDKKRCIIKLIQYTLKCLSNWIKYRQIWPIIKSKCDS